MASDSQHPKIFLAFRFHANFYHSYRGDTPDELGFGKDIRIIRKIIEVLDSFNAEGVPARGTWDIENYFSLETIMPEHCPDIIESLKRRVDDGKDEVQVMSYNNGLISAQTASEFEDAIGRARFSRNEEIDSFNNHVTHGWVAVKPFEFYDRGEWIKILVEPFRE